MKYDGKVTASALLLSLLTPGAASAKEGALLLEPSSKWNVHYADDFCRLWRSFGEGRDQITLVLDRFQPSDSFRLTLAGQPMGGPKSRSAASIRFGNMLPEQKLDFFPGSFANNVPAWVFANNVRIRPYPDPKDVAAVAADGWISDEEWASVTAVRIGKPFSRVRVLDTGPMSDAFDALHRCTVELVGHWGIDVKRHGSLTRWPKPVDSPATWLRSDDYPRAMLEKWQPGLVQFRLTVGEEGKPPACHIQQSTNPEGFNKAVCDALMKRASFEPALDADGKPLTSFYISSVKFQF